MGFVNLLISQDGTFGTNWAGVVESHGAGQIFTLNPTVGNALAISGDGPGLAFFKDEMWLVWSGIGNHNFLGIHGLFSEGSNTLSEGSQTKPALAVFRDRLILAWSGMDSDNRLNVMSSADGLNFDIATKRTLSHQAEVGPALAVFNDRLFLAWSGKDSDTHLNIAVSDDGLSFDDKRVLAESSGASPALAAFAGRLHIAWAGKDSDTHLNIMSSPDGLWFDPATKRVLEEKSGVGPSLATFGDRLVMAWAGKDPFNHLNVESSSDGLVFDPSTKRRLDALTGAPPAIAITSAGQPFLAFTGKDSGGLVGGQPSVNPFMPAASLGFGLLYSYGTTALNAVRRNGGQDELASNLSTLSKKLVEIIQVETHLREELHRYERWRKTEHRAKQQATRRSGDRI